MNFAVLLEPASAHVLVVDDDPDLLRLLFVAPALERLSRQHRRFR